MLVLVCYDVNTETSAGRRRLRRVAKVCESTGQRVQKSVFECQLDVAQFETLEGRLLAEIDPSQDCLRLYRIPGARGFQVAEHGQFKALDFDGPLVL
ncbi:CRISPR-associated endonuclease Cas2 [Ottowia sp.]|jgi:CRISPR-associated protein Cas2|uniref:CRISPR-associated endonuclease Cas2 n=1 Tax=Ottowia sp. TaxID=1898956 RepID=UPI0025E531C4|nr:CRISPR-associated endonuclease Cas2 [Ottowia sp.]MBK6612579.1 CRISPR-associated endonuclease Cas2 [Ottowia sp.]MBK6748271.1 CRISPR-associated endonuclease Cas2 [Ottowia sp.]